MQDKEKEYSLGELAELLGLELQGDPQVKITAIATLGSAGTGDLSFFHNSRYSQDLKKTSASAVILNQAAAPDCPANKLLTENPYLAYARASHLFAAGDTEQGAVHPSAIIHKKASLAPDVIIGANVVIHAGAVIGKGSRIGPNTVIGRDCILADDALLHPNVTLYPGVRIGYRCIIHSGVVIGSDGFGFARDGDKQVKIAQLGSVRIGDDVEIGAGSTVDRGALEDTVIEDGVKIDNQVQIAHNVRIGSNTVICGCSAIAGSSSIGKNCIIAGAVGIINHINIADDVTVTAMSLVNKSITEKGIYSSGTGLSETELWKKNIVHFRQLDELNNRIKVLELQQEKSKG